MKRILLDIDPLAFETLQACIPVYHDYLHDARRFGHDISLTKKEIDRRIIRCHRLMATFSGFNFNA